MSLLAERDIFRRPEPLVSLFAGVVVLALAVPRAAHHFILFPSGPVAVAVSSMKPVSSEEIVGYHARLERALNVLGSGISYIRLGRVLDIEGYRAGYGSEKGKTLIAESTAKLEKGLSLKPSSGFAWLRLAELNLMNGDRSKGASALGMSYMTARYDKSIVQRRLDAGIDLFREGDDSLRSRVVYEFRTGLTEKPKAVLRASWKNIDNAPEVAREALGMEPDKLKAFMNEFDPFRELEETE